MTDPDTVQACPHCDKSRLESGARTDYDFRCWDCGARLDREEVVERERREGGKIREDSLAHKLDQMDPDDLAADGGRSP